MKKILVVGYAPYGTMEKLVAKYPDVLWFEERKVGMSESAFALIELVDMMDGVLFMKDSRMERKGYEIVCTLKQKQIYEEDAFPVEEKEEEK